jgi:hypothetical protein
LENCGNNSPFQATLQATPHSYNPGGIAFANCKPEINYMFIIRKNLHQRMKGNRISLSFLLPVLFLFFVSCNNKAAYENLSSPEGYDLNNPSIVKLPGYLDEISGIAYYPKDKGVFAINDEKGWLYKINFSKNMPIQRWKYAKGEDFEDLALVDSIFYVLQSSGKITEFKFYTPDSVRMNEYESGLPGNNEFEILYYDKERNQLVLLCKDCDADDKNTLSSLAFDLASHKFLPSPPYVIDVRKIETLMQQKKVKFKPSAAAIHPITGELFIVSSVNKVLVIADRNGVPKKVHKISPRLYKQPEGLAFTPEGHLLISNESADIGAANILIYKYKEGK